LAVLLHPLLPVPLPLLLHPLLSVLPPALLRLAGAAPGRPEGTY
jgi:hypothetical protein